MIRINPSSQLFKKQLSHLESLAKKTKKIETFYLFGSTAENKNRPNSDIDFAVLLNSKLPKKDYLSFRLSFLDQLSKQLKTDAIDLILLNEATVLLAYEVIRTGKVLFEKDRSDRIAYECKMMSFYYDMKPFYAFQRETLKAKL